MAALADFSRLVARKERVMALDPAQAGFLHLNGKEAGTWNCEKKEQARQLRHLSSGGQRGCRSREMHLRDTASLPTSQM